MSLLLPDWCQLQVYPWVEKQSCWGRLTDECKDLYFDSIPTNVKCSIGGRTQQILLRLSPTFPKIFAKEREKETGKMLAWSLRSWRNIFFSLHKTAWCFYTGHWTLSTEVNGLLCWLSSEISWLISSFYMPSTSPDGLKSHIKPYFYSIHLKYSFKKATWKSLFPHLVSEMAQKLM